MKLEGSKYRIKFCSRNYMEIKRVGEKIVQIRVYDGIMLIRPIASNVMEVELLTWFEYYEKRKKEKPE